MRRLIFSTIFLLCMPELLYSQDAEGALEIVNVTRPWALPCHLALYRSVRPVTDGFDGEPYDVTVDLDEIWPPAALIHSVTTSTKFEYKLCQDERPMDNSNDYYLIYLTFWGSIKTDTKNYLLVNYHYTNPPPPVPPFGDKNIYAVSSSFSCGWGCNVRKVIQYALDTGDDEPNIPLLNLVPGYYNSQKSYAKLWLSITDRPIFVCDLRPDGIIDFKDFAVLARDWGKPQGKYRSDVSGICDGVPDGYVDIYDLIKLADEWLVLSCDITNDGKIDLKDYSVIAAGWQEYQEKGDIAGESGLPDGFVDIQDLQTLIKQWPRF